MNYFYNYRHFSLLLFCPTYNYLFCSYNHLCIMHISDIKLDFILLTIHFIFLPAVFI